ncbi:28S ribosomal protein S29, mitochondrial [Sphaerodactylus townsendi]|uniref:28S ribosomal protein S29, mitochondrial n=1 Tax=Sphaerodactylus townsendi TaxID=933632 RepID=UPI0020274C07|nr:28S ribosomal protein S29, mitochondrial [Sphaerodactylus townsendi]XP_048367246.1 28S ribosomal protein S29, mitochondrial [Sphaerodactylus townsendi]XP_048367255.1 28S ribosomal protein S29, mitochondrial [Sphaerodactylus townsendi]XP_048367266.1 28S ribosomal protein S29, mitochondrial [Sphaerodactylus townsendi]XP_048367274.1 28S ribosomal protein S29, mitochondrial [Sphaerodactylus townsendi]
MLRNLKRLLRRSHNLEPACFLQASPRTWQSTAVIQDAPLAPEKPRAIFRTNESDPANHTEEHVGHYYSIPLQELKVLFPHGLPGRFQLQVKTLNEACFMVRKPALELLSYLKGTNFAYPAIRYVVYGERATGKTVTLCQAVHYCAKQNWLILHIPDAHRWVKNCKELLPSSYKKERFDQPLEASTWLKNFAITNEPFLKEIKTQQKYTWSKRESSEEGSPLISIVEQGLNRVRSASDVVGVVLKELKQQSSRGSFKLLVAVDGVNSIWGRTLLKKEDKSEVSPEELTLVHNLRKMMSNDWTGGAIVTTLSQTGAPYQPRRAFLPSELLGKEGFEALDPFVPIRVDNYTDLEFESCYQYYLERRWLQHESGKSGSF